MKKILLLTVLISGCTTLNSEYIRNYSTSVPEQPKDNEIVIGGITGTTYNLEVNQCDANPFETADGSTINPKKVNQLRWVALSRDLIKDKFRNNLFKNKKHWNGVVEFGDTITIVSDNKKLNGKWVVKDVMNSRFSKRVDFMQDRNGFAGKWENLKIVINS